jgi:hypothetical protein
MRNKETGEFEVIVGNRQLLSGFFIVALLFAVAFAMGYVVGQNSPRSAKVAANGIQPPTPAGEVRPQPAAPVTPAVSAPEAGGEAGAEGGTPAEAAPQPTTQPARDPGAPAPAQQQAQKEPAPAIATAPLSGPPGTYWQVMALSAPEAEIVYRTLKDKGFPSVMTQGPNNLVRVLVGPYADTLSMGKAKTELEDAGFRNGFRYVIRK